MLVVIFVVFYILLGGGGGGGFVALAHTRTHTCKPPYLLTHLSSTILHVRFLHNIICLEMTKIRNISSLINAKTTTMSTWTEF